MRTPVFELHILPMIRAMDREKMMFRFDLWNYDSVKHHAQIITARLEARDMPPPGSGGPWPDEWIELFKRWAAGGFKRLAMGTALYEKKMGSSFIRIYAKGQLPSPGYKAWLQLDPKDTVNRAYILCLEAPDQPTVGPPQPFEIEEKYAASDVRQVMITDANGSHVVTALPAT